MIYWLGTAFLDFELHFHMMDSPVLPYSWEICHKTGSWRSVSLVGYPVGLHNLHLIAEFFGETWPGLVIHGSPSALTSKPPIKKMCVSYSHDYVNKGRGKLKLISKKLKRRRKKGLWLNFKVKSSLRNDWKFWKKWALRMIGLGSKNTLSCRMKSIHYKGRCSRSKCAVLYLNPRN